VNQQQPPLAVVLGAAGFIGRHVCRTLASRGIEVVGIGHGTWEPQEWSAWGLTRFVDADIGLGTLSQLGLSRAPSSIVHCAGSSAVSFSYAQPLRDFERAVETTAAALEWMRTTAAPDCRLVMVSSAAIYGDQGDVDLSEAMTQAPISPYGFHKVMAETLCNSYSRFFGLNVSIVRLFSVYGSGLRKQLLWDAASKFARGESSFFGTGHELRDWIHVDDAAALLGAAATVPQSRYEIYNGGHAQLTTSDILARLARALDGAPSPVFTGETHSGNPRRLTSNSNHARRQLGWTPLIDTDAGLRDYATWFRALDAA